MDVPHAAGGVAGTEIAFHHDRSMLRGALTNSEKKGGFLGDALNNRRDVGFGRSNDQAVAGEVRQFKEFRQLSFGSYGLPYRRDFSAPERFAYSDSSFVIDENDRLDIRCDERNKRIRTNCSFASDADGVPARDHAGASFGKCGVQWRVGSGNISSKRPEGIGIDVDNNYVQPKGVMECRRNRFVFRMARCQ